MFTRTLRYGKGYTGKLGNRAWVARITGTDGAGLQREFLEADKAECEHFNRQRTIVNLTWGLDVGLYECAAEGERWFFFVNLKNGQHAAFRPSTERVTAIAKLMDSGMSAEEARLATKPAVA